LAEDPSALGFIYMPIIVAILFGKLAKTPAIAVATLIKHNSNISYYWNCAGPIAPNHWLAAHGPV